MLKIGSTGDEVKLLQSFLKQSGYKIASVDGQFGKETENAVIEYQKRNRLFPDGEIGANTAEKLKKDGLVFSVNRGAAVSPELTRKFIDKLCFHAERFEGFVEIRNNSSWDDPEKAGWQKEMSELLTKYMLKIQPWALGEPYCAACVGAFIIMALEDCKIPTSKFERLWTAHVMTNVRFARKNSILSITPSLGSIWLARFGSSDSGHAGLVINIRGDNLETIEGNTVAGPSLNNQAQRSGNGIFKRRFYKKGRGSLQTQGFLSAENILKFFVY